jgi:DNA-binding CsgD family transcriptional regulator
MKLIRVPTVPVRARSANDFDFSDVDVKIIHYLALGDELKEIAVRLTRSEATIKSHLRIMRLALGARSLRHLVALALKYGVISMDDVT